MSWNKRNLEWIPAKPVRHQSLNRLLNEDVDSVFRGFEGQLRHSLTKNETSLGHTAWGSPLLLRKPHKLSSLDFWPAVWKFSTKKCSTHLVLVGNLSAKTIHHKLKGRHVVLLTSPHEVHGEKSPGIPKIWIWKFRAANVSLLQPEQWWDPYMPSHYPASPHTLSKQTWAMPLAGMPDMSIKVFILCLYQQYWHNLA